MQKNIFMLDFIDSDIPDELERLFILKPSIHAFETRFSHIFHVSKARTSKFGINTLTYDSGKIRNQCYFDFI